MSGTAGYEEAGAEGSPAGGPRPEMRAIADRTASPMAFIDPTGRITHANAAAGWLLGTYGQSLGGVDVVTLVHPHDRKKLRQNLAELLRGGLDCTPVEYRVRAADGTWRTVNAQASNLLDIPGSGGILVSATDVTEQRSYEQSLEDLAHRDPITGLPNRRALKDHLDHAMATDRPLAVAFIDIDHLTRVNDLLGHTAGDLVLQAAAHRLGSLVPRRNLLAHFGADIFVAVLVGMAPTRAERLAWELASCLRDPMFVAGRELRLSASVGLAARDGASTTEGILRDADSALTRAKRTRRGGVEVFTEQVRVEAIERMALEADLRQAIERCDLEVHFQPIVRLDSGAVVAHEALVRWPRPEGKAVGAGTLVSIAEETGLIEGVTDCVLDASLAAVQNGLIDKVNVNLSPLQLLDSSLYRRIGRSLKEAEVPPEKVGFEVTEAVVIENFAAARECLQRLRRIGCSVGLDDFGTGYSSLGYLRRLPVDFLKLDQQLVEDVDVDRRALQIAEAIVTLARTLSLTTVAEGVERQAQAEALAGVGCDLGQGWLFGRPQPI